MRINGSVLIEVLSVLFIVGVLAVVAIPDFDEARPEARHRSLIASLETVRTALDRYWADHDGVYPTIEQMRALSRSRAGSSGTGLIPAGLAAYLDGVPRNPFTNGDVVGDAETPIGASDWVYDARTGVFKANDSGEHRAL